MTLRGVILYRPHPQITNLAREGARLRINWDGPASIVRETVSGAESPVHSYVIERAESLDDAQFIPVTEPMLERSALLPDCCEGRGFYRVRLIERR